MEKCKLNSHPALLTVFVCLTMMHVSHSQVALSEKSQDAVIALGIFFLDSGCTVRCADNVVPYLLSVERALSSAAIVQPRNGDGHKKDQERPIFSWELKSI